MPKERQRTIGRCEEQPESRPSLACHVLEPESSEAGHPATKAAAVQKVEIKAASWGTPPEVEQLIAGVGVVRSVTAVENHMDAHEPVVVAT